MIWHLIAAVFAGLAAAGIGLMLRAASGRRLPKWIVPVFGGLGLLGYQVQVEYTWYEHKTAQLPDEVAVVSSQTRSNVWRPWTFAVPLTSEFSAVDTRDITFHTTDDSSVAAFILYHFERHRADSVRAQAYWLHCDSRDLVPLDESTQTLDVANTRRLNASSELAATVCRQAPVSL